MRCIDDTQLDEVSLDAASSDKCLRDSGFDFECVFSSQNHMIDVLRTRIGATPGALR